MIAATLRLARSPRHRLLAGAGGAAGLLALLSAAPGGLASTAARAALAVAVLAAAPALLRGRAGAAHGTPSLRVIAREPLGRDAGVAIVVADGRRLLVGFGPQGVRALAAPEPEEVRP